MSKQPLFFRIDGVMKKIDPDEIMFLETAKNYVKFFSLNSYLLVRTTIDDALLLLPAGQFFKVHRSYAVSVNHINEIATDFLTLTGVDWTVPISRQYYTQFIRQLTIIGSGFSDKKD
jgi:DNA-binding LytR/AlgR family response regulator